MEPMNDRELNELLQRWEAPVAPAALERRIFRNRRPWYAWLVRGSIRVPVPVAAMLLLLMWSAWRFLAPPPPAELTFSDFQPVKELKPRVVQNESEAN